MATMHNALPKLVLVQEACMSVISCTLVAAKLKPSTFKILAKADVKRHVAVIGMHVQAQIFADLVPHDKGVVPVKVRPNAREKMMRNQLQEAVDEPARVPCCCGS